MVDGENSTHISIPKKLKVTLVARKKPHQALAGVIEELIAIADATEEYRSRHNEVTSAPPNVKQDEPASLPPEPKIVEPDKKPVAMGIPIKCFLDIGDGSTPQKVDLFTTGIGLYYNNDNNEMVLENVELVDMDTMNRYVGNGVVPLTFNLKPEE